MGERSRDIMKQFEHPENIAAIVQLPELLIRVASGQRREIDGALDVMIAAAIIVILNVPMRMENNASLTFGETFLQSALKGGKVKYEIDIPSHKTKNLVHIEGEIDDADARIVSLYVENYRSVICSLSTGALFPRPDGRPRDPGKLSTMISDRIARHTGLKMTAHCFRHLAAKIYLDTHPGQYEDVRRILGHRSVKTTIDFYAPRETKSSQRKYHASLTQYKKKGSK
jgi:integrase